MSALQMSTLAVRKLNNIVNVTNGLLLELVI